MTKSFRSTSPTFPGWTEAIVIFLVLGGILAPPLSAAASCTPGAVNPSVTVCLPMQNAIVPTPTHVVANTTDSNTVNTMKIFVDKTQVYSAAAASLDTYVNLSLGNHNLIVQATDSAGQTFSKNVAVAMTPPCPLSTTNRTITICNPPSGATLSSPVHLVAGITDSTPLTSIQVLQGGTVLYQTSSTPLDVYLTNLSNGSHTLTISVKDRSGASFTTSRSLSVTTNAGLSNIRHIIFFVQENRSFDSYFGRLGAYRVSKGLSNSIDGLPLNVTLYDLKGNAIHPYPYQTVCTENLNPVWKQSHLDMNGGKMDAFLKEVPPTTIDPTGTRALGYYDSTDLPFYYDLATEFATSDRFFSPVLSNTIPNRMYLFAATSFGHVYPAPPPTGGWTQPTIFDHLDAAHVSWRYYYQDQSKYISEWSTYERDAAKVVPISNWYADITNESTLPSVIFIERAGTSGLDEHPLHNVQKGANDAYQIIHALRGSPSWFSSVFIETYDEGGGLYDHVVPIPEIKPDNIPPSIASGDPPGDFAHSGFRVPLIVISPWVKPHFVSHVWRDYTSILRLIEVRFHVASLTARDATADDMMEFFDFSSPHLLNATLTAQTTGATCDDTKEKPPGF